MRKNNGSKARNVANYGNYCTEFYNSIPSTKQRGVELCCTQYMNHAALRGCVGETGPFSSVSTVQWVILKNR